MEVIILAGGLGTRLRSVVKDVPKCMADVNGKPFLWYILKWLSRYHVTKVILSVGYLNNIVSSWVRYNSKEFSFKIELVIEKVPLGTGGAIKYAMQKVDNDSFVVINGDTLYMVNIDELQKRYDEISPSVLIALKPMSDFDRYGEVIMDANNGKVLIFNEKQHCENGLINGGIYAIKKGTNIFDGYEDHFSFEKDILQQGAKANNYIGYVCNDYFIDIGIPSDYAKAIEDFPSLFK
jgi:D-glycero-alpha-D-manno-heptose 1-phosphate guanylyltransferase